MGWTVGTADFLRNFLQLSHFKSSSTVQKFFKLRVCWNGRFSKKMFATQSFLIPFSWTENFQIEGGLERKIFKENLYNSVIFNPLLLDRKFSNRGCVGTEDFQRKFVQFSHF